METKFEKAPHFDPEKDYFKELKASEKYKDKDSGKEYPYLKGLWRLANTNRGGILEVNSQVLSAKRKELAAVTVTYIFKDGTAFSGSADASVDAHDSPFNQHLVAVAESKAEARALRRAFNITQVAKEEIGSDNVEDGPIQHHQISALNTLKKRKKLSEEALLGLIDTDASSIKELTDSEARQLMKAVNTYKQKKK